MDSRKLGILGGGQLGRMMVEITNRLNIETIILDSDGSPAKQINNWGNSGHINGSFSDEKCIEEIAEKCDVLTVEIEHVNVDALEKVMKEKNIEIHPSPETLRIIQDKYNQKEYLTKHGISVAEFKTTENNEKSLEKIGEEFGYPFMLKARTLAYDGRGNYAVKSKQDIPKAIESLSARSLYAEKWEPFIKELATMVVRTKEGNIFSYPVVETIHQDNICHIVYAPARVSDSIRFKAKILAEDAVSKFSGAGIFGVEMFLSANGKILINEIAPRPHNSGHYTQDACIISQFEAHIRAVLGLPIPDGSTEMITPTTNAIMLNILGGDTPNSELKYCHRALAEVPKAAVHLYGKSTRPKRKMGHINIVSSSMQQCEAYLSRILEDHDTTTNTNKNNNDKSSKDSLIKRTPYVLPNNGCAVSPIVGVIMGSDSDLKVMSLAGDILTEFGIPFELTIVSAHRTPIRMFEYSSKAAERGLKAIIAGAGGAAHLPGMVAAQTTVPVIGVPVKGSSLDGVDSLYSIVQMPRGVPVATVAINNSTNAALLAIRIIGVENIKIREKLDKYMHNMESGVLLKAEKLERIGYKDYSS